MFGMLSQNVHWTSWLKHWITSRGILKKTSTFLPYSLAPCFLAMASQPSELAPVPIEGEMEVDYQWSWCWGLGTDPSGARCAGPIWCPSWLLGTEVHEQRRVEWLVADPDGGTAGSHQRADERGSSGRSLWICGLRSEVQALTWFCQRPDRFFRLRSASSSTLRTTPSPSWKCSRSPSRASPTSWIINLKDPSKSQVPGFIFKSQKLSFHGPSNNGALRRGLPPLNFRCPGPMPASLGEAAVGCLQCPSSSGKWQSGKCFLSFGLGFNETPCRSHFDGIRLAAPPCG